MSRDEESKDLRFAKSPAAFYRYPYTGARYGAYDGEYVRVEQDTIWGIFTRNAEWIEGPLRVADPIFARWVTGKHLMDAVLERKGKLEEWS